MDDEHEPFAFDDEPVVQREIALDASPDEVWAALTEPDRLSAWVGGAVAELEIRPGGRGTVHRKDGAVRRVMVEAVEPGRRLALRWWPFEAEAASPPAGSGTRVEFRLEQVPAGVVLRVVERGPLTLGAFGPANSGLWLDPDPEIREHDHPYLAGKGRPDMRAGVR
jgi:uncharacterized protein YndB with AHSA1/START domain